ncbi:MAG: hypothetical protein OES32_09785 [Acidobacteriota bacterium]|nr:hypothetical protein [Acidobacteriota bacterium]
MDDERPVERWHGTIIRDCRGILGRDLVAAERLFITSRRGLLALEIIHDSVKDLAGEPERLRRYLNSEAVREPEGTPPET